MISSRNDTSSRSFSSSSKCRPIAGASSRGEEGIQFGKRRGGSTNLQSRSKKPAKKLKASTPGETFHRIVLPYVPFPNIHISFSILSFSLSLSFSLFLCFLYDPLIQCAAEQPNLDNKARREQRQKTLTAMLYKVVHPDSDNLVSAHGCRPTREWSVIVLISQHAPGTYLYVLYLTRSLYRRELYSRGVNLCDHRTVSKWDSMRNRRFGW